MPAFIGRANCPPLKFSLGSLTNWSAKRDNDCYRFHHCFLLSGGSGSGIQRVSWRSLSALGVHHPSRLPLPPQRAGRTPHALSGIMITVPSVGAVSIGCPSLISSSQASPFHRPSPHVGRFAPLDQCARSRQGLA